jgi:CheY-like chemotaxis protein
VTVSHRRTPEGRVELAVSDTGTGIPTDKSDRLFVPFDRLGAEERGVEGIGLGLALSKRLVEAMGGSLVIDSDERTGTEVRITLEGVAQHAVVEPRSQATRTLLVVGGSESNTALVKSLFKGRQQYRLLAAAGGQDGLQSAVELRPELVVLDTDGDGREAIALTQRFKDHPDLCDTKVIVMSDSAEDGHIERLKAAGAFAVVVKPLDLAAMLGHVDSAFGAMTR